MDSEALKTFVAIHRTGGVSAAAAALHRSQPAISRRLALLEAGLGTPLFERVAGGTVLSQAGAVLLPYAERVLAQLKDADDALAAVRRGEAGAVSLAAVGTLAGPELTSVLRRFADAFPKAELALQTATSAGVSELVRRGEATIGLRYFADPVGDLVGHPLPPERQAVVCAGDHPLAGRRVRALAELAGETWLAFPRDYERREAASETLFAQFLVRGVPEIAWTAVDSLSAQKRLIEAGFGLALLQLSAAAEERAAGTLAVIDVADLDVSIPVFAVVRRGGYLNAAAQGLLTLLRDAAGPPSRN